MARPVVERFWARVDCTAADGCWLWLGGKTTKGYGLFYCRPRSVYAHRFAYELLVGPIGGAQVIDHLCRNTSCVNPTHLESVTNAENIRRGYAVKPRKTHCPRGHAYSEDNTYVNSRGYSECRRCHRDRGREAKRRARTTARAAA